MGMATAVGIEPTFSAPATVARLEDESGYAVVIIGGSDWIRTSAGLSPVSLKDCSYRPLTHRSLFIYGADFVGVFIYPAPIPAHVFPNAIIALRNRSAAPLEGIEGGVRFFFLALFAPHNISSEIW